MSSPSNPQWNRDVRGSDKHKALARAGFRDHLKSLFPLLDQAKATFPGRSGPDVLKQRGKLLVNEIKILPKVQEYLFTYMGTDDQNPKSSTWRKGVLNLFRDVLLGVLGLNEALEKLDLYAGNGYQAISMMEAQAPLRKALPPQLREFLPKNVVVDVDQEGNIKRVTDRFENEKFTLEVKIYRMKLIINQYNKIVQRVKKDLTSSNEITKLCALVTSIIMETGIRPAAKGNAANVRINGEKVLVETFGAVTLGPSHVKFVRNNFVELEFIGKKAGKNLATITDQGIIQILQSYVDRALTTGSPYVFVTAQGVEFTYGDLKAYFDKNFKGIAPTDFRKLRATEAVLDALREAQEELYAKIRGFAQLEAEKLRERIIEALEETLNKALDDAMVALSHDNAETTLTSYINPNIFLQFLSSGKAAQSLEDAVLDARPRLTFDPMTFAQIAGVTSLAASYQRGKVSTLRDLLVELGEELELSSMNPLELL